MSKFIAKQFTIRPLQGLSETTIAEHIKLYEGYVKHSNLILDKIESLKSNPDSAYELTEARRRFGFEFDGMRNHELYFGALEGEAEALLSDSKLNQQIIKDFGSFDAWLTDFKTLAKTRGIGWTILYYDKTTRTLLNSWVDEQHLGHLVGLTPIIALDMWEHSFVADYLPSGKAQYIDDYLSQINWTFVSDIFDTSL
jgi:superoxide dismutase, Fe-Mn family